MYAEIPDQEIETQGKLLDIGKVYEINNFQVKNARPTYMLFGANLMIEIGYYAEIKTIRDPIGVFPEYIYNITPFDRIKPSEGPPATYIGNSCAAIFFINFQYYLHYTHSAFLVDIIGYIAKIDTPTEKIIKGRNTASTLREIII